MTEKNKNALNLVNQMLEQALLDDEEHKKRMVTLNKGGKAVGEGWWVFHLKILKETLEDVQKN